MTDLTIDNLHIFGMHGGHSGDWEPLREWLACPRCEGNALLYGPCDLCGGSGFDPDKVRRWCIEHDSNQDEGTILCFAWTPDNPAECRWSYVVLVPIGGNDE